MCMCINTKPTSGMSAEYTHIINEINRKPGQVHLAHFSSLCASWITTGFDDADYAEDDWHHILAAYIFNIICESNLGLSTTIVALTLIERYQEELSKTGDCVIHDTVDGTCRLFLAAYMGAVKSTNDEHPSLSYWMRVTDFQYTRTDLTMSEMRFYDDIQWMLTIGREQYGRIYGEMMWAYRQVVRRFGLPSIVLLPGKTLNASDSADTIEEVPRFGEEDKVEFTRTMEPLAVHQAEQKQPQPRVVFPKACYSSERS